MAAIVETFTNVADGVSGVVVESAYRAGSFGAGLRDDDAGEFVGYFVHGLTYEDACAKARSFAGLAPGA